MERRSDGCEAEARRAFERAEYDAAATLILRAYSGEIMKFLMRRLRNDADASEVFSQFALDFWHGLPAFEWRSTSRTWAYALARRAASRHIRAAGRRERACALENTVENPERIMHALEEPAENLPWRCRETEQRVRELRNALAPKDQRLVALRIDEQMKWLEIALALDEVDASSDRAARHAAAARIRKRFQAAKTRLRQLAKREGLLPG